MLQHSVCVAPFKRRHWGEEQIKRVWEGQRHTSPPLVWHQYNVCESGENGVNFNTVQTQSNTILYSLKTLTSWKNWKHGTQPIRCKLSARLKKHKGNISTVYNYGERSSLMVCSHRTQSEFSSCVTRTNVFWGFFCQWWIFTLNRFVVKYNW